MLDFSLDEGDPSPAAPSGKLEALAVRSIPTEEPSDESPIPPSDAADSSPAPDSAAATALPTLASFSDKPLTEEDLSILTAIERLADGLVEEPEIRQVKPAHMVAALVRLLIRKGVIKENDFLSELSQK
jgi:hypothetical protein